MFAGTASSRETGWGRRRREWVAMARTVRVDLGDRGYNIRIGEGMWSGEDLDFGPGTRALVVTDSNVAALHGDRLREALREKGIDAACAVVPAGECSKSMEQLSMLLDEACVSGLDRASLVIALGGGMIGDLAGFLSAIYLRGIGLIQVPTTLLSMVDSSVGGKTGVNLPHGKNLAGCFHQPLAVVADLTTLATLPAREFASGLAEVVKYGVIWDAVLFDRLEETLDGILARDGGLLEEIVARCCEIKADVVAMDERESGVRAILNFGHTFGHALERAGGYGQVLHGEAVAVGMAYACELSVGEKGFDRKDADRVIALLERAGLPVRIEQAMAGTTWESLRAVMASDKKARNRELRFVLAEKMGSVVFGCEVAEAEMEKVYGVCLA